MIGKYLKDKNVKPLIMKYMKYAQWLNDNDCVIEVDHKNKTINGDKLIRDLDMLNYSLEINEQVKNYFKNKYGLDFTDCSSKGNRLVVKLCHYFEKEFFNNEIKSSITLN